MDSGISPVFADRAARSKARAEAIEQFLTTFAPEGDHDLLGEMMVTLTRLAADRAGRGEMKILSRAFKELRYAFKVFAPFKDVPKVSIFGSARTPVDHPQYLEAVNFARLIRDAGWMVITGAGDGIMRAGHDGATRESSFGVNIALPFEQATNDIIAGDSKLVNFNYFFTRKLLFVKEADGICLFPGGYGTQDEGFEALTLIQTGKAQPAPIVLCDEPGGTYWQHWRTYVKAELLGNGMIGPEDMHLFFLTDSAEQAVEEIVRFYRRYHSSRFVREAFAIRMKSRLAQKTVDRLAAAYADICLAPGFEQTDGPLGGEDDEFPEMPRLTFRFNGRNSGRLRMLINEVNDAD